MRKDIITREFLSECEWNKKGYTISDKFAIKEAGNSSYSIRCKYCGAGVGSVAKPAEGCLSHLSFFTHNCKATNYEEIDIISWDKRVVTFSPTEDQWL